MSVYSNIVKLSYVDNSYVLIISFFQQEVIFKTTHWVFNPPLYVRVKEKYQYYHNGN